MNEQTIDKTKLKQINSRSFYFGLELILFKKQNLFFDRQNLYMEDKSGMRCFPLESIISVARTYNMVGSRNQWEIDLRDNGKFYSFRFFTNWTLWNNNFEHFINLMKRVKPEAVKNNFNIWGT